MSGTTACAKCGKMTSARLDGKPSTCFACLSKRQDKLIAKLSRVKALHRIIKFEEELRLSERS